MDILPDYEITRNQLYKKYKKCNYCYVHKHYSYVQNPIRLKQNQVLIHSF